jgi:hypothetical protein
MSRPAYCLFDQTTINFHLYDSDDLARRRSINDSRGNPIIIRTVKDVIRAEIRFGQPSIVSFDGYQGYVSSPHEHIKRLGILIGTPTRIRSDFRRDDQWVQNIDGTGDLIIRPGTMFAILGQTKNYATMRDQPLRPPMTQIGLSNETGFYTGYIKDEYLHHVMFTPME